MKIKFTSLLIFMACFVSSINAQDILSEQTQQAMQILQDRDEIIIKFNVATKDQINNDLTNIMSIDNVKTLPDNQGYEVRAYANSHEYQEFLTRNIPYEIIPKFIPKAMTMATTVAQMLVWDKYPTYTCYEQMMLYFETNYPTLVNIDTILSPTPSGNYRILVAKISDNVNTAENEPQFFYSSTLHGDEATGYYMMLRLINYLLTNYGNIPQITNLVNGAEIWICPDANPEGTYYNSSPVGSTVANSRRANLAGFDLNRNFPDPRAGAHPDGNAHQAETKAFMAFADKHHFNMAGNFHGGTEVMNYPWDTWTTAGNTNADAAWWERVCTNYVTTTRVVTPSYMTDSYPDGVTEGGDWYVITGGRQDYMNFYKQCREVTLEVSITKLVQTQNLNGFWNTNYQALLNYMEESLYGIRGIITDGCSGQPIKAKVFANGYDQANDSSHVYSALPVGNYHKYVNTGTYSLTFSAPGYISQTISGISVTNGSATVVNVVLAPSASPTANFTADYTSTCSGKVQFTNTGVHPQSSTYLWNFGDGNTSTLENPLHYYTANGTYSVSLQIFSCVGNPSITKNSYISVNMPANPTVTGGSVCNSGTVSLSASGTGTINWYNDATAENPLGTGSPWVTPSINTTTTFYAEDYFPTSTQNVGATYTGTLASSNSTSYLTFNVTKPIRLISVEARAGTTGYKTITLQNSSGVTIQTAIVNFAVNTKTTITLDWIIPAGTGYRLVTATNSALYRRTSTIAYPYSIAGLVSITGCSSGATIYSSYFNWLVKEIAECSSARVPVIANVLPPNTAGTPSSTPTLCINTALSPAITIATTGATGIGSPTGLPAGVTAAFASNTITISGTPSASGTFNYSIPLTGGCGSINATGTLTVSPNVSAGTVSGTSPLCIGNTPTYTSNGTTGGTWTSSNTSVATVNSSTGIVNALTAGTSDITYTVNSGCGAPVSALKTITVNPNIEPSFTQLGPYCVGATPADLPTNSNNSFTGSWNPSSISTATADNTTYTFTPNAGQCATSTTMSVLVNDYITPIFSQLGPYCVGDTPDVLLQNSTNGVFGTWDPSFINTSSDGIITYTYSPLAEQCAYPTSMDITVSTCTGIEINNEKYSLTVIPNPSDGIFFLNVEGVEGNAVLKIFTIDGKIIFEEQVDYLGLVNKKFNLRLYPKGIYILTLINNNITHTEKIIIE